MPALLRYFAYGSNLNARAVTEWCRHHGKKPPPLKTGRPAVLHNYRLCFPLYSETWAGGIADVAYDPGKSVSGAIFDLTEADFAILDEKVGRKISPAGKEIGLYRRIDISVQPLSKAEPVTAVTYQGCQPEKNHIPPSQYYMELVLEGAFAQGLSMMWIAHLSTFRTQATRRPRPPGYGDSAPRM